MQEQSTVKSTFDPMTTQVEQEEDKKADFNASHPENSVLLDTKEVTAVVNMSPTSVQSSDTSHLHSTANGSDKKLLGPKIDDDIPPKDRNNWVFLIFVLHGIGVLMAWNMFITAKAYFVDYKLVYHHVNDSSHDVLRSESEEGKVSEYRANFLSYLGVAAQIPNVVCNGINLFSQSRSGNMTVRVTAMIVIECLVCLLTLSLALTDSTSWPICFFYITMVSVVVMNMASGVYQSAVYGVAAKLPMTYSNAVVLGSNISGTLVSVVDIISHAIAPDARTSALYYFVGTLGILIACLISFHVLPFNNFYRHFDQSGRHGNAVDDEEEDILPVSFIKRLHDYWTIFQQIWPQCLNVFMVFFVTLSIFPAIHSSVESSGQMLSLGSYFTPVTCFLLFNATAMIGNLIPNWIIFPGPKHLYIPVFARLLFIPFFLLCNYKPHLRVWPVIFNNDYVYVTGGCLLGLSSGYFSSLSMMYAPRGVDSRQAGLAAMMASFFLMLGLFVGINASLWLSMLVEI